MIHKNGSHSKAHTQSKNPAKSTDICFSTTCLRILVVHRNTKKTKGVHEELQCEDTIWWLYVYF